MNAQISDIIKARATQFGDYIFYDCTKIMLSIDHVSLALRLEYLYLRECHFSYEATDFRKFDNNQIIMKGVN